MDVIWNVVMMFARSVQCIDVNRHMREIPQVMHELMANLHGDFMALFNGKLRGYRHVHLGVKPVSYPSYPDFSNIPHAGCMLDSVSDFISHIRIDSIEKAGEYRLPGLPDDAENRKGDNKANKRVCQRITEPDPDSAKEHGEAGQPIDAGVMAVGN